MTRESIGAVDDFVDGEKKLFTVGGVEIGVFRLDGAFFAWKNVCPHQGGPVCQGRIFKRVVDDIDDHKQIHGRRYHDQDVHIVCPWHGAEFDIRTGRHAGLPDLSLTRIPIDVEHSEVYVRVE